MWQSLPMFVEVQVNRAEGAGFRCHSVPAFRGGNATTQVDHGIAYPVNHNLPESIRSTCEPAASG